MITFSLLSGNNRGAALVGDTIASALGQFTHEISPSIVWNVTTQPSGSDVLSGQSNVAHATALAATFAVKGYYAFTLTIGDRTATVDFIVWPVTAVTTFPRIKYETPTSEGSTIRNPSLRSMPDAMRILRSLAAASTKAGAQLVIETNGAASPAFGVLPSSLGAHSSDSLIPFGGTW